MSEALEKAKKNLGLGDKPGGSTSTTKDKPDAMTELEAAINKVENIEAKELLQAKARELKAQYELRAREAESRARTVEATPPGDGAGEKVDEKLKAKQEMIANSLVLLEKGVDPDVVARYIIASSGTNFPVNLGGGGQQGLTVADIKTIVDMVKGSGGADPQITATLNTLTETVKGLKPAGNVTPPDPAATAKAYAEAITNLVDSFVNAGLVVRPGTSTPGKSIEEVKETNRHLEKMEELKTDRWYKEQLADTLGGLPEQIGEGIAGRIQAREGAAGGEEGQEYLECTDCHTKIPIFDKTTNKIECPKCHAIFTKKAEAETAKK